MKLYLFVDLKSQLKHHAPAHFANNMIQTCVCLSRKTFEN